MPLGENRELDSQREIADAAVVVRRKWVIFHVTGGANKGGWNRSRTRGSRNRLHGVKD